MVSSHSPDFWFEISIIPEAASLSFLLWYSKLGYRGIKEFWPLNSFLLFNILWENLFNIFHCYRFLLFFFDPCSWFRTKFGRSKYLLIISCLNSFGPLAQLCKQLPKANSTWSQQTPPETKYPLLGTNLHVAVHEYVPDPNVQESPTATSCRNCLPSSKLTWQWKVDLLKMYSLLNMRIFHCYVSLPECNKYTTEVSKTNWPSFLKISSILGSIYDATIS